MTTIDWRLVFNVSAFTIANLAALYAAFESGLIIRHEGVVALQGFWLHAPLSAFSALCTTLLVHRHMVLALLATSSAILNALLI
jgi:hypothetical protein